MTMPFFDRKHPSRPPEAGNGVLPTTRIYVPMPKVVPPKEAAPRVAPDERK